MYQSVYDEYDEHVRVSSAPPKILTALQARRAQQARSTSSGFQRIELCRRALEALDTRCSTRRSCGRARACGIMSHNSTTADT